MSLLSGFIPVAQDSEGRIYPNAKMYTYATGTYTPKVTYFDVGNTIPNTNPVIADGAGRFFNVFLGSGGYRVQLRDQYDAVIWTEDNYYSNLTGADLANIDADIAAVSQQLSQTFLICVDSGTADHYILDPSGVETPPAAYGNPMIILFVPGNANTGASTVNVSGLGTKSLKMADGSNLPANFLATDTAYQFIYFFGAFYFYNRSGLVVTSSIASGAVTLPLMANGVANDLLAYDSSGVPTNIKNPFQFLTGGPISSVASIPLVLSSLDTANDNNSYLLRVVGAQPATNAKALLLTFSTDGGSTYVATNYGSAAHTTTAAAGGTSANYGANAAAQISILGVIGTTPTLSNSAGKVGSIDIYLRNINTVSSVIPSVDGSGSYWNSAGDFTRQTSAGSNSTAGVYNAIKLTLESGGNFTAVGNYYLYKIPNAL